ncbi:hypothetical protein V6N11_018312 [Hibiscus sabdariffa]|uniref:Uncharacterized protein n=1 Tax=Hibiscus sabdariffa TaxID=183260 RepID=A0ABR2T7U7_9ROSI
MRETCREGSNPNKVQEVHCELRECLSENAGADVVHQLELYMKSNDFAGDKVVHAFSQVLKVNAYIGGTLERSLLVHMFDERLPQINAASTDYSSGQGELHVSKELSKCIFLKDNDLMRILRRGNQWQNQRLNYRQRNNQSDVKACAREIVFDQSSRIVMQAGIDKLVDAIDKVCFDGVFSIESSYSFEIIIEVEEGMEINRGYIFSQFRTNSKNLICEFENVRVLITDKKILAIKYIIFLLEKTTQLRSPLLRIVEDVQREVLATLVVNKLRDVLNVAAINASSFGERREATLQDLDVQIHVMKVVANLVIEEENQKKIVEFASIKPLLMLLC